ARAVDVHLELLARGEPPEEARVGLACLRDRVEDLLRLFDVERAGVVTVLLSDQASDARSRDALPRARSRLAVHQHRERPPLEGQRLESLHAPNDDTTRARHSSG